MQLEIKLIKKQQTEGILKLKNLTFRTGTWEVRFINRLEMMEERISWVEDVFEKKLMHQSNILLSPNHLIYKIKKVWDTEKKNSKKYKYRGMRKSSSKAQKISLIKAQKKFFLT